MDSDGERGVECLALILHGDEGGKPPNVSEWESGPISNKSEL